MIRDSRLYDVVAVAMMGIPNYDTSMERIYPPYFVDADNPLPSWQQIQLAQRQAARMFLCGVMAGVGKPPTVDDFRYPLDEFGNEIRDENLVTIDQVSRMSYPAEMRAMISIMRPPPPTNDEEADMFREPVFWTGILFSQGCILKLQGSLKSESKAPYFYVRLTDDLMEPFAAFLELWSGWIRSGNYPSLENIDPTRLDRAVRDIRYWLKEGKNKIEFRSEMARDIALLLWNDPEQEWVESFPGAWDARQASNWISPTEIKAATKPKPVPFAWLAHTDPDKKGWKKSYWDDGSYQEVDPHGKKGPLIHPQPGEKTPPVDLNAHDPNRQRVHATKLRTRFHGLVLQYNNGDFHVIDPRTQEILPRQPASDFISDKEYLEKYDQQPSTRTNEPATVEPGTEIGG